MKGRILNEVRDTTYDEVGDFSDISNDCEDGIHDLTIKQRGFSDIKDLNDED
jgi:hypothetical protein